METDKNRHPKTLILIGLLFATMVPLAAAAQSRIAGSDQDRSSDRARALQEATAQAAQAKAAPLESTIDPRNYYVGPSDVLAVNVWLTPPLNFILTVTPEGTLIIPSVGEVRVADTTLAEAKTLILAEIRKRYKFADATVTLLSPRSIVVTVTGNVLNPGSYVLTSTSRVDKALEEANRPRATQDPGAFEALRRTMSTRNIAIRHKNGSATRADVTKFFATKVDLWNPYLREGDIIVVPRNDFSRNVIGVYGEVNAPGRYEYVEGDSISDALRIAYGFTRRALTDTVELSRLDLSGQMMTVHRIGVAAIAAGRAPDVALGPGDRILVRGKLDLRADYRVKVIGEVLYPGTYPIARNATRLTEIIRQAGGFTEFASLTSSVVLRQSVQPAEIALERLESLRGGVPPEDSLYYYLETDLRIRKEAVNVDFQKLFVAADTSQDVILQDEDNIVVTSLKKTIYVFGQVVSPGNVAFVPGRNVEFYVAKAGGFTERARQGDVKIVKAKTRQWLAPKETSIEEGDYVWVPKEIERPFAYYMSIIGQTASIVSVAVSIVLLVIQINK